MILLELAIFEYLYKFSVNVQSPTDWEAVSSNLANDNFLKSTGDQKESDSDTAIGLSELKDTKFAIDGIIYTNSSDSDEMPWLPSGSYINSEQNKDVYKGNHNIGVDPISLNKFKLSSNSSSSRSSRSSNK